MKQSILHQKIASLQSFPSLDRNVLKKAELVIQESSDWKLLRINPIRFAKDLQISESASIDFFIHAAKIGLFDFAYNLLCPMCGGIVHSHHKLDAIQNREFQCVSCDFLIPTLLDDQVEVAFAINDSLRTESIDPFASRENYFRFYFSENYEKSKELRDWIDSTNLGFVVLDPEETFQFHFALEKGKPMGEILQFVSIDRNTATYFHLDSDLPTKPEPILLDLMEKGLSPTHRKLGPGKHSYIFHNRTKWKVGVLVLSPNPEKIKEIVKIHPTRIFPFLTAKKLLNNQSFRELFRIHSLSSDLNLNVKSLTILFTDLRGSTEMYDKAGDITAYKLVQEHFRILTETVREFQGAIVKTMGDAIMATFSNPLEGLLASLSMMQKIHTLNAIWEKEGYQIGLKIGLNEGSALAVISDERLDYFGQSVNIAARVQGLAKSGEIWISESIWHTPGLAETVEKSGYAYERQEASLKGVGSLVPVYKLYLAGISSPMTSTSDMVARK